MRVVFSAQAEADLDALYEYFTEQSGDPDSAFDRVWKLRGVCKSLSDFPNRGSPRDHIRKDLRVLIVEKRSIIAYQVKDVVEVVAVFHGGQDWWRMIQAEKP
jgi:toxin ParE1/3/4